MLKEYYLENIYKKIDLNCAESVLYTANDVFSMNLTHEALRVSSAFGGGMFIEEKCGAVTGALMAIGYLFVPQYAHTTDYLKDVIMFFFNQFTETMGSCECIPLKELHRSECHGCRDVIAAALDILEKTISEFPDKRVR